MQHQVARFTRPLRDTKDKSELEKNRIAEAQGRVPVSHRRTCATIVLLMSK